MDIFIAFLWQGHSALLKPGGDVVMDQKPTYQELEKRVKVLEMGLAERQDAEEALREGEQLFRILVEAASRSGQAIAMHQEKDDGKAVFVFANEAAACITGYAVEELGKMSWLDVVHPRCWDAVKDRYTRRFRGEDIPGLFEITIVTKNGTEVPIEVSSIRTEFQGKTTLVTLFRDITERKRVEKRLRESEEKYRSLVESTEDSIYLVDRHCTYLFVNRKLQARLHMPREEIIGKGYGEFHSEEETSEFSEKVSEVFETGNSLWYEHQSRRDEGYFIRTLSPGTPLSCGDRAQFLSSA
jgi:PAS domain S-box-containing protein